MTKRFYVQNVDAWKKCLDLGRKKFLDRKLEVKVVERGIILPARPIDKGAFEGGVCDSEFNFVTGFSRKPTYENSRSSTFGSR